MQKYERQYTTMHSTHTKTTYSIAFKLQSTGLVETTAVAIDDHAEGRQEEANNLRNRREKTKPKPKSNKASKCRNTTTAKTKAPHLVPVGCFIEDYNGQQRRQHAACGVEQRHEERSLEGNNLV